MRSVLVVAATALLLLPALPVLADHGLLPNLQTVVPRHLDLQNSHQREILRFSNGIANTGAGDWRLRPEFPLADPSEPQRAIQEILAADGSVAHEEVVSAFEYHPTHNHWHIAGVDTFALHHAADDGTGGALGPVLVNDLGAAQSVKTTFCLIDWVRLEGNAPTKERTYFDCFGDHQGISPGWIDQYHHATDGQALDVTDAPPGVYYLVSEANADEVFLETDTGDNLAWTSLRLSRDSNGNAKIKVLGHSACASDGLCGEQSANR